MTQSAAGSPALTEGVGNLLLLRHGESEWNHQGRFAGWADVALTPRGEDQARRAGQLLRRTGLRPDAIHTSALRRAATSAQLVSEAFLPDDIQVRSSWRLNERHYGALQGRRRADVREELGSDEFMRIRRSLDGRPPEAPAASLPSTSDIASVESLDQHLVPRAESLTDVRVRVLPYWSDVIAPELRAGRTVVVAAHGNTIRVLRWHLEGLTEEQVREARVPLGSFHRYRLDVDELGVLVSEPLVDS